MPPHLLRAHLLRAGAATTLAVLMPALAQAQDVAAFYKGRQVNMFIASAVGGGYDAYARLVGRHIGRYIPGNPSIVPMNMPGASGTVAVQHMYTLPKEGTAFAAIVPGGITRPLYDVHERIKYDFSKLVYLGSANTEVNLCWVRTDAKVKTFKDLFSNELIIGASGEGDSTRDFAVAENSILGTKFRVVQRYKGVRDIVLAMDRGEVAGLCGTGVPAMMVQRPDWVAGKGGGKMLVQQNVRGKPKLTDMGVPRTGDFAKTPEDRDLLGFIYAQQQFGRPFVTAPGAPPERVAALRQAFTQALQDKELLAEAAKMNLDIDPLSGTELQEIVERLYATPAPIVKRAISALIYNAPK
jgi:tripartite-type tricarboxylate transporter receptor subunit TctC